MALVLNQRELYQHAVSHEYIIPAFNCFDIESMRAIVMAAEEEDSPVVLQVCMAMQQSASFGKICFIHKGLSCGCRGPGSVEP